MASAWGSAWASAWGNSWGAIAVPAGIAVAGGNTRRRRRRAPVFFYETVSAPTIHLRLDVREADDTLHAMATLGESPKARRRRRTLAILALQ